MTTNLFFKLDFCLCQLLFLLQTDNINHNIFNSFYYCAFFHPIMAFIFISFCLFRFFIAVYQVRTCTLSKATTFSVWQICLWATTLFCHWVKSRALISLFCTPTLESLEICSLWLRASSAFISSFIEILKK